MRRGDPGLEPELEAFLKPCKIQREVPSAMRSRVLARARDTVAGREATVDLAPRALPPPHAHGGGRARRVLLIALAASIVLAGATVGAVAALRGRRADGPRTAAPAVAAPAARAVRASVDRPPAPAPLALPAAPPRAVPGAARRDPFSAELDLLQRAHAAYTRRDFSVALALVGEHAKRFPRGHLAEQREALRVRSLVGAGRGDDAHRAAAAFAVRFPRSVLLPRVAADAESAAP